MSMSVNWFRSPVPRLGIAALVGVSLSVGPKAVHADSACDTAGTVVTTCADRLSGIHQSFLQQRKQRAVTLEPEDGQVSGRLSGRAWDANANGDFPVFVAPAGTAVEMRTSVSKWGAYFAREDMEKVQKVEDFVPEGMALPEPAGPASKKIDVWTSTKVEGLAPGSSRHGLISHLGADYAFSNDFLVGASVEFEDLEQSAGATAAAGTAYMIGPYLARRLTDDLVFDARLAWGESTDVVEAEGIASRFGTERRLAKARLEGDFELAGWQVSSSAAFIHATEVPEDGFGQGVTTNKFTLGPEMRRSFQLEDGPVIEPFLHYRNTAALDAVESWSKLDALAFEGTLGGGVNVTMPDSYKVQATTEIESGDTPTNPNVSGRVQVTIPIP